MSSRRRCLDCLTFELPAGRNAPPGEVPTALSDGPSPHLQPRLSDLMTNAAASHQPGSMRVARSLADVVWADTLVVAAAVVGCVVIFESASFLGFAINGDTLH